MKQSASPASLKKRLLGGLLPPVLALLIIYFLTFLCELLIHIGGSTSYLYSTNPILGPVLDSCALLAGTYFLAIPISLFVWLPYYILVPYPSKWWEPTTAIFTGAAIFFLGFSLEYLLLATFFNSLAPIYIFFIDSSYFLVGGAFIASINQLTIKYFKMPYRGAQKEEQKKA